MSPRTAGWAGLSGSALILSSVFATALQYLGHTREAYSPLNHFVSELGQLGVSSWAPIFNGSIVVGNAGLIVFTLGLVAKMRGVLGSCFGICGIIAAISGTSVGVFPMNYLAPHLIAALIFFYSSLAAALFFSLHALLRPWPGPGRWLIIPSLINVASFIAFLIEAVSLRHHLRDILKTLNHRPDFWHLPALEWLAFLSLFLWIVLVSACLLRRQERTNDEALASNLCG